MMDEIQKRPFARPLFWWVVGVVLQVCFPLHQLSVLWLLPVCVVLFVSFLPVSKHQFPAYHTRWVWGACFACLLTFLSVQQTALAEQRRNTPASPSWLEQKAQEVQLQMVRKLDVLHLSDGEKAVLATLTVGYRQSMDREIRKQFSVTGLAHLLSVSGFHVGVIYGILSLLLSWLPSYSSYRLFKWVFVLLLIWAFTFITGLSLSAIRASLMFSIYLTGSTFRLYPDRYNTWAAAAFCMLVYQPFYLFDIGFQLSFTAVFFILYLQPRLNGLIELKNPLFIQPWGILTVTVAAQIGTLFLSFYYFGQTSTVFLFTNLFLSVLATLVIPLALLLMVLPAELPGVSFLAHAIEFLTHGLMWLVNAFSQIRWAIVPLQFDFVTLVGSYVALGSLFVYFQYRHKGALFTALGVVLFLLSKQLWQRFLC